MHRISWNPMYALLLLVALPPAAMSAGLAPEAEEAVESATPSPAAPPSTSHAEPARQPAVEHAALIAAYRGEPFSDPPQSPAVAAAMARVLAAEPPPGELFALVTVTDRVTGERRVMTRGTPSPDYARWIADPDTAPPGRIYWESDDATANAAVEVVVRAVHERDGRHRRSRLDKEEERALKQRNRGGGPRLPHRRRPAPAHPRR